MRLIDANALIQKIDEWRENIAETYGINDEYAKVLGDVIDIIDDAPEKLKRKKGKWIPTKSLWKYLFHCSNCNYPWHSPCDTPQAHFCPNCGSQNEMEIKNEKVK